MAAAVTKAGEPFPWAELSGVTGTVCVLMGARHLAQIARGLMIDAGRAPETPVVLAERVSTPRCR